MPLTAEASLAKNHSSAVAIGARMSGFAGFRSTGPSRPKAVNTRPRGVSPFCSENSVQDINPWPFAVECFGP